MAYLNTCLFIGNVGKAPEVRVSPTGDKVAKFSLAVTKRFKDRQGVQKEKTTWINCVTWKEKAVLIERFVGKGDPLFVESEADEQTWDAPDGTKKSKTIYNVLNIQLLKARDAGNQSGGASYGGGAYGGGGSSYGQAQVAPSGNEYDAPLDDQDLPF